MDHNAYIVGTATTPMQRRDLTIEAMAHQVVGLMVFLMNLTEPSKNVTFTPPGWFETAPITPWSVLAATEPV